MVKKAKPEELGKLRAQIRDVTLDIIAKAHKRMELSERIGTIKGNLNIDIQFSNSPINLESILLSRDGS